LHVRFGAFGLGHPGAKYPKWEAMIPTIAESAFQFHHKGFAYVHYVCMCSPWDAKSLKNHLNRRYRSLM
jgi:hypothetical protein